MNLQPRAKYYTANGQVLRQQYGTQRKQGKDCHKKKGGGIRDYGTISWGIWKPKAKTVDLTLKQKKKIKKSLEGFEQTTNMI